MKPDQRKKIELIQKINGIKFPTKSANALCLLIFIGFTVFLLFFYISRPLYNHDLSGYLGVILSYDQPDPEIVHEEVFARLKECIPEERFVRLTGAASDSGPAIRLYFEDPDAFRQTLPFYRVRILYTGMIYALYKAGVDPIFSSHAISAESSAPSAPPRFAGTIHSHHHPADKWAPRGRGALLWGGQNL